MVVATAAMVREFPSASSGDENSTPRWSPSDVQYCRPNPELVRTDRHTSDPSGIPMSTPMDVSTPTMASRCCHPDTRRAPLDDGSPAKLHRCDHRPATTSSTPTSTSWPRARNAAVPRSSNRSRSYTSTSMVRSLDPPSSSTTPNDVKQNRYTTEAAASTDGASMGSVTSLSTRNRLAPSTAAASAGRRPSPAQATPTTRTTTA